MKWTPTHGTSDVYSCGGEYKIAHLDYCVNVICHYWLMGEPVSSMLRVASFGGLFWKGQHGKNGSVILLLILIKK